MKQRKVLISLISKAPCSSGEHQPHKPPSSLAFLLVLGEQKWQRTLEPGLIVLSRWGHRCASTLYRRLCVVCMQSVFSLGV